MKYEILSFTLEGFICLRIFNLRIMISNYMQIGIEQAKQVQNEIPVGAVIVRDGQIVAQAHNTKEHDCDVTSHAEIVAIKKASEISGNWRLDDCDIYVTLEPCPMCGWAILQARIKNIYFGSYDTKYGAFSVAHLEKISEFKSNIFGGICEGECDELLKDFFENIRK